MKSPIVLAWREAVRELLPAGRGMTAFYRSLGWHKNGRLSSLTKNPDVRLTQIVGMADALGVDRTRFWRRLLAEAEAMEMVPPAPPRAARKKNLRP